MNLRRTPLLPPQGLDLQPMPAPTFPAPQGGDAGNSSFDMLAGLAQQHRAGVLADRARKVNRVQAVETDSPLLRRKPLFEDLMGAMGQANV